MTGEEKAQAKLTAENLNKSFFAHGDAVSRNRAKDLQLKIAKEDMNLEALIWKRTREHLIGKSFGRPSHLFLGRLTRV